MRILDFPARSAARSARRAPRRAPARSAAFSGALRRAPMLLIRALLEQLPNDTQASAINILDQKISEPNPAHLSYTASRYALLGLTAALPRGLAPAVRVNAVAPGHTLPSDDQSADGFERAQAQSPLGYGPAPADIADAVGFLMGARAVTGQVLFVDSGERFLARSRDVLFETERL